MLSILNDFRPMLAASVPPEGLLKLWEPDGSSYHTSVKYDGVRAITTGKGLLGRSLKPIRNKAAQKKFSRLPYGLDGELILLKKDCVKTNSFYVSNLGSGAAPVNLTTSFVNSVDSLEDQPGKDFDYTGYVLCFLIFDSFGLAEQEFRYRYLTLVSLDFDLEIGHAGVIQQVIVKTWKDYLKFTADHTEASAEGFILKRSDLPYKFGRSTLKSGHLLRDVAIQTDEATLVEVEPRYANTNESQLNELGYLEKRNTVEAKAPLEMVGALWLDHPTFGKFKVGTGLSDQEARYIWANRDQCIGQLVTFAYKSYGLKDKPRQPVFKQFRSSEDL